MNKYYIGENVKNIKSKFFIFLLILCILFTVTCVSAQNNQTEMLSDDAGYHSFNDLNRSISESKGVLNLVYDYRYGDNDTSIIVNKDEDFTINGNGHTIENFNSQKQIFINNLTFKNCVNTSIVSFSSITFNNVKFINCTSADSAPFIQCLFNNVVFINCTFK